ncbi:hypothetical protein [Streptomyces inhibens]|uniref:hypothetical protein n=1 Tax=Streptomyces inhibens TaxID=2293571 RepID=UPI001EE762C3|nr:hypothetical protein [Streptomyces inhibens]UKY47852.1 hypothetical protein KI385_02750 [Streptomyces inhibens]
MRTLKRSVAYGAAAAGLALIGTLAMAPIASADSGHYIQFSNNSGFLVDTCYQWQGPDGIESKNYCHTAKPVGQTWKAYFPAEATGATATVTFAMGNGGAKEYLYNLDSNSNHCFQTTGLWPNGQVLRTTC